MLFFVAMSLSPGAHPKRKSKKVLDPDFQCDFPPSAFLQGDLNLEEQSNPATYNRSTKQSTQSSKLKSAMVLAASSSPIAIDDTASSALSFGQQLQPLKLQKDKLELELKVLTLSTPEMSSPLDNNKLVHPSQPSHNKCNIHWPQDFVPSIQGEYNKIQLPEIVAGFLIMIKYYNKASKDAMLAHLELLTIEAISYLWVSVQAFLKFIANMLSGVIWIGKILSLFRIRPPLFSTIHTRLHPLLPRLVDLFVISKMLMLLRHIIDAECARLIILCYTALNVVHRYKSFNTSAVVRRLIASCHNQPNAFGAKLLVSTSLLLTNWRTLLSNYSDKIVVDFLPYGWPINYTTSTLPASSLHKHPSASHFDSHVQAYIDTELAWNAIARPLEYLPFSMTLFALLFKRFPNEVHQRDG